MAEAMAHAHERGVLHRDIKPSNVLVTADGLPMLLDFNLARDPLAGSSGASAGGTLAYMAPEHLDSLADGDDSRVDGRADVFGLGVLLFEALTGRRPFAVPAGACSVAETLRRAADERRSARPSIRETHPEVPAAMEAVVLKCLADCPDRRYPDASMLAVDLQAVADDAPLACAREPLASRVVRWGRRRRWPVALAVLLAAACAFLANGFLRAREDHQRTLRIVADLVERASGLADEGRLDAAGQAYSAADAIGRNVPDFGRRPTLLGLVERAGPGCRGGPQEGPVAGPPGGAGRDRGPAPAAGPRSGRGGAGGDRRGAPAGRARPPRGPARTGRDPPCGPRCKGQGPRGGRGPPLPQGAPASATSTRAGPPWSRPAPSASRSPTTGRPGGHSGIGSGAPSRPFPAVDSPGARSAGACILLSWLAESESRPDVALGWARRAVAIDPRSATARAIVARLSGG